MLNRQLMPLLMLGTMGCGAGLPSTMPEGTPSTTPQPVSEAETARARQQVTVALQVTAQVRAALELLGVFPEYTCGEPRRTFVGRAVSELTAQVACVTASAEAEGGEANLVRLHFAPGCQVNGHVVEGDAVFRYSGGESRMDLEAELQGLWVDGERLTARAGYGTCSDEKRVWAGAAGALVDGTSYRLDVRVALREGLPLIGHQTLILDGAGGLRRAAGVDGLTVTALEYEVGAYAPKSGAISVFTAAGQQVDIRFTPVLWRAGKVSVAIDGKAPVTVPLVH